MGEKAYQKPVIVDRPVSVESVIRLIDLVSAWRAAADEEDANSYTLRCCADELEIVLLECLPPMAAGL